MGKSDFWTRWKDAVENEDMLPKIAGVIIKYHNFEWGRYSPDMKRAFYEEVQERCLNAWDGYDETRSAFVTWVVWHSRSIADSIIKSSQAVPKKGMIGRGLKWPFNIDMETTFADESDDESGSNPLDSDDNEYLDWMVQPEEGDDARYIRNWVKVEMRDKVKSAICIAIFDHQGILTDRGIARATGYPTSMIRTKLEDMGKSFLIRVKYDLWDWEVD